MKKTANGKLKRNMSLEGAEGEGGPLTEFDSEESPLSIVHVAFRRKRTEMGWY